MHKAIMLLAAIASATVWADSVYLKSGTILKGAIKAVTDETVTVEAKDIGELKIKVSDIAKLEDAGERLIQFKDGSVETKKLAVADGAYLADGDTLKMGEVKAIDPKAETWHGSLNVSFTATRGNTYENSGSIIGNLTRRWEHDRVTFNGGYYSSRTGTSGGSHHTTVDRWELEGQEDHFWSVAFYNYLSAKYEHDRVAQLNSRFRLGLGGGYQWLEKAKFESTGIWNFNQEFGLNWVKEDFEEGDEEKNGFAALRYAHHLTYAPKWNDDVECFHNLEYIPEVDDWEKYLAKVDIGFTTKIIGNFDLLAKIEWDFNSKPASDRKKADTRYLVGLGYKW